MFIRIVCDLMLINWCEGKRGLLTLHAIYSNSNPQVPRDFATPPLQNSRDFTPNPWCPRIAWTQTCRSPDNPNPLRASIQHCLDSTGLEYHILGRLVELAGLDWVTVNVEKWDIQTEIMKTNICPCVVMMTPCGFRGCKYRSAPFPSQMS